MSLKAQLTSDMKDAMRAKERERLGVVRMLISAVKSAEIDTKKELTEAEVLAIVEKQVKQRRESIKQFADGGRDDLVAKEQAELEFLTPYLPEPLSDAELDALIDELIKSTGATSVKDMGKVMGQLKARAQGRVDLGAAGGRIKARLG
ncbi:MAG: GatB/YqeY domain-containing protein [Gammaproteobacteria bacterium]